MPARGASAEDEREQIRQGLEQVLSEIRGCDVAVLGLTPLTAGASRAMWTFGAACAGQPAQPLVLRVDAADALDPDALFREAGLMAAAGAAGVPSPRALASGRGDGPLSPGFVVMEHVDGETLPRRILRDPELAALRSGLAAECGRVLAGIHRLPVSAVEGLPHEDPLDAWHEVLVRSGRAQPALELGARWLADNRPPAGERRLVHGDFRHGNLIVGPEGIRAVLDWELAHIGDPLEDLGWLCARAWRFGGPYEVGGFGSVDDLVDGYEAAGGRSVDRDALHWWLVFATFRWGVITIVQSQRHTRGTTRSVELAAIGRRTAEAEWDLLTLLP